MAHNSPFPYGTVVKIKLLYALKCLEVTDTLKYLVNTDFEPFSLDTHQASAPCPVFSISTELTTEPADPSAGIQW